MQADTWEGEFNGPASPSTVRENIEVRFLFYSIAGGLGNREKDKKEALLELKKRREKTTRRPVCASQSNFPIPNFRLKLLIWPLIWEQ